MRLAFGAFLLGATLTITGANPVLAAAQDYVFEAVQSKVQESANAIISVRLINKVSRKPVADAVILQTRLDMSPDNMADMTTKVTPLAPGEPGVHRFQADLSMGGRWALKLAAKVPGEQETVRGEVVVTATK
jgi:YtkA-like protein